MWWWWSVSSSSSSRYPRHPRRRFRNIVQDWCYRQWRFRIRDAIGPTWTLLFAMMALMDMWICFPQWIDGWMDEGKGKHLYSTATSNNSNNNNNNKINHNHHHNHHHNYFSFSAKHDRDATAGTGTGITATANGTGSCPASTGEDILDSWSEANHAALCSLGTGNSSGITSWLVAWSSCLRQRGYMYVTSSTSWMLRRRFRPSGTAGWIVGIVFCVGCAIESIRRARHARQVALDMAALDDFERTLARLYSATKLSVRRSSSYYYHHAHGSRNRLADSNGASHDNMTTGSNTTTTTTTTATTTVAAAAAAAEQQQQQEQDVATIRRLVRVWTPVIFTLCLWYILIPWPILFHHAMVTLDSILPPGWRGLIPTRITIWTTAYFPSQHFQCGDDPALATRWITQSTIVISQMLVEWNEQMLDWIWKLALPVKLWLQPIQLVQRLRLLSRWIRYFRYGGPLLRLLIKLQDQFWVFGKTWKQTWIAQTEKAKRLANRSMLFQDIQRLEGSLTKLQTRLASLPSQFHFGAMTSTIAVASVTTAAAATTTVGASTTTLPATGTIEANPILTPTMVSSQSPHSSSFAMLVTPRISNAFSRFFPASTTTSTSNFGSTMTTSATSSSWIEPGRIQDSALATIEASSSAVTTMPSLSSASSSRSSSPTELLPVTTMTTTTPNPSIVWGTRTVTPATAVVATTALLPTGNDGSLSTGGGGGGGVGSTTPLFANPTTPIATPTATAAAVTVAVAVSPPRPSVAVLIAKKQMESKRIQRRLDHLRDGILRAAPASLATPAVALSSSTVSFSQAQSPPLSIPPLPPPQKFSAGRNSKSSKHRKRSFSFTDSELYDRMVDLTQEVTRTVHSAVWNQNLISPQTRFSVAWRLCVTLALLSELGRLLLSWQVSGTFDLRYHDLTKRLLGLCQDKSRPVRKWIGKLVRLPSNHPWLDTCRQSSPSSQFSLRVAHMSETAIDIIGFLDILVWFFTGELNETGIVVPKPFVYRCIIPGTLTQMLDHPTVPQTIPNLIVFFLRASRAVGYSRVIRWGLALYPALDLLLLSPIHRYLFRPMDEEEYLNYTESLVHFPSSASSMARRRRSFTSTHCLVKSAGRGEPHEEGRRPGLIGSPSSSSSLNALLDEKKSSSSSSRGRTCENDKFFLDEDEPDYFNPSSPSFLQPSMPGRSNSYSNVFHASLSENDGYGLYY